MTRRIREIVEKWDYEELFLPNIEAYDNSLRKGLKITHDNEFYLVNPDVTSQIVKRYKSDSDLKVYYVSEVQKGIKRDLQAGIEYIGKDALKTKVEVLNILIEVLESLHIQDFYIDISSLKVWREMISDFERYEDKIFEALKKRNLSMIDSLDIDEQKKQDLWDLLNLRGKKSGFSKLDRVLETVDDERVFADLGTVRPLPYYDDMIFEVYSANIGSPIGAGGEYFVNDKPACGFALDLQTILEIYDSEETVEKVDERKWRSK